MGLKDWLRPPAEGQRQAPAHILYDMASRPPVGLTALVGAQHALVALMFGLYAVLAARGSGLDGMAATGFLSLALAVAGLLTVVQSFPSRFGAGRLLVYIPDPVVLIAFLLVASSYGLGAAAGGLIAGGAVVALCGRSLPRLRALLPPEVTGTVVLLLGASLAVEGVPRVLGLDSGGGVDGGAFLSAVATLCAIVGLSVWSGPRLKVFAVIIGVGLGLGVALVVGDFAQRAADAVASLPVFAPPGAGYDAPMPEFIPAAMLPLIMACIVAMLDQVGTTTAVDRLDNTAWRRSDIPLTARTVTMMGLGTALSGLVGTLSPNASTANLGLAHASGVSARRVGVAAGVALMAAAFVPAVPAFLIAVPDAVIGAIMVYSAAFMVVAGAELILSRMLNARRTFVVGLGSVVGLAIIAHPELAEGAPALVAPLLQSGLAAGTVTALLLNLLFRLGIRRAASEVLPAHGAAAAASRFLDEHGGDWGARRDVINRAGSAVGEALEALHAAGLDRGPVTLHARFDEFNLELDLHHEGPPLALGAARDTEPPDWESALEADDDQALEALAARLSETLIAGLADRVSSVERNGGGGLHLHFDH